MFIERILGPKPTKQSRERTVAFVYGIIACLFGMLVFSNIPLLQVEIDGMQEGMMVVLGMTLLFAFVFTVLLSLGTYKGYKNVFTMNIFVGIFSLYSIRTGGLYSGVILILYCLLACCIIVLSYLCNKELDYK